MQSSNQRFGSADDTPAASGGARVGSDPAVAAPSWHERLGTGALDPLYGMAQLGARLPPSSGGAFFVPDLQIPPDDPGAMATDKIIADREHRIDSERKAAGQTGTDWWRVAGQIISPPNLALAAMPTAGAPTLAGRLGLAAASGAASAATEPVERGDFWAAKAKQLALGAGVGGGVAGAMGAAGRAIAPAAKEGATKLAEQGVVLTPGQALGGTVRRAEEAAKSFPILGSFVRGSEGRSVESFNKATINQALEPIGATLPKDVRAGHEAVRYAADEIGASYDRLLPAMRFHADPEFTTSLGELRDLVREMPPAQAQQFGAILENRLARRLGETGTMDGLTLKQVESELRVLAEANKTAPDPLTRQLGYAIDQTRALLREALERQNPEKAVELRNINSAYAMLTRVEDAAGRRLASGGVFSPTDLMAAVKKGDKSVRKREFAHGDALMQEFATIATEVLPARLPDSGTTERALWDVLGGAAIGIGGGHFDWRIPVAGGLASLPYTAAGQRAANVYLLPGEKRRAMGSATEAMGLSASPAAASAVTGEH